MISLSMVITPLSSAAVHGGPLGAKVSSITRHTSQELPVLRIHQMFLSWRNDNNIPRFCFMAYGLLKTFQDIHLTFVIYFVFVNKSLSENLLYPGQCYFSIIIVFTNILN